MKSITNKKLEDMSQEEVDVMPIGSMPCFIDTSIKKINYLVFPIKKVKEINDGEES